MPAPTPITQPAAAQPKAGRRLSPSMPLDSFGLRARALLTAGAVAALAIFAQAGAGVPDSADAAGRTVKVGNDFFSPTSRSIARGQTVTWVWAGGTPHDVVAKNRKGKIIFRSKITKRKGYTYSHKFGRSGTYKIICSLHVDTMRMTVKVS